MNRDLNYLLDELEDLIPQLRNLVQSNSTFERYILPAIIAGIISVVGILINNFISVYVFKKKRSLEYGRFYLPYLSFLKDIECEMELLALEEGKNIFCSIIRSTNLQIENSDIHFQKILESFTLIDKLFSESSYYIIDLFDNLHLEIINTTN